MKTAWEFTRPIFVSPGVHCVQIKHNVFWSDYASINDQEDMAYACGLVERFPDAYRIICYSNGINVVYGN
jgi:hypothetical protein